MSLKAILESLDGLPEALKPFYAEKDGKFILQAEIEGHPAVSGLKSALEKERSERKAAKEALGAFADLDPEAARAALAESAKLKEKKLIDAGKLDELVSERTAQMKANYEKQLKELSESNTKHLTQLEKLLIESAVQAEAAKSGVHSTALEDVVLRAKGTFKIQDGKAVPFQGENVVYGKDGANPMSVTEWMGQLQANAPHLFKPSQGGGAVPGAGTGVPHANSFTLSREAAKDAPTYQRMRAEAAKVGQTVQITD